ncbi:MAG TPA: PAS domain-containing protein, partial [Legionellaceae bacterium]|nr:PAS domain-containing protein [Legionellaceae bacterium]
MLVIPADIEAHDLENVLTVCNSLKFAVIGLSLDYYITHINAIAEWLFLNKKSYLLNRLFPEICQELGLICPFVAGEAVEDSMPALTTHSMPEKRLINVYWTISRCRDENGYTGYILTGKMVHMVQGTQPFSQIEEMLRALPCAVFTKDQHGNCLSANQYQAGMAGFRDSNEMIGKNDYDLPWASQAATIQKNDQRVITENKTILIEEKATLASGKKEVFLVTKSPFRDKNGQLLGIAGTSINISQYQPNFSQEYTEITMDPATNISLANIYLTKKEL